MRGATQLLLLAVAAATPSVLHRRHNGLKTNKRIMVVDSHADVQGLASDSDEDPVLDHDTSRADGWGNVEVLAKEQPKMMRGEKDECYDWFPWCESKKADCDRPFHSTVMSRSCRKTCGICTPAEAKAECQWSSWEDWSQCDQSCGTGVQFRKRTIKRAAQNGGDECQGPNEESSDCNRDECPTTTTLLPALAVTQAPRQLHFPETPAEEKKKKQQAMLIGGGSFIGVSLIGAYFVYNRYVKAPAALDPSSAESRPRTETTLTQWTVHDDDYWGDDYDANLGHAVYQANSYSGAADYSYK